MVTRSICSVAVAQGARADARAHEAHAQQRQQPQYHPAGAWHERCRAHAPPTAIALPSLSHRQPHIIRPAESDRPGAALCSAPPPAKPRRTNVNIILSAFSNKKTQQMAHPRAPASPAQTVRLGSVQFSVVLTHLPNPDLTHHSLGLWLGQERGHRQLLVADRQEPPGWQFFHAWHAEPGEESPGHLPDFGQGIETFPGQSSRVPFTGLGLHDVAGQPKNVGSLI